MKTYQRPGRINTRLLMTLVVGLAILLAGVFGGHRIRKKVMADSALKAGQAAWEREDFSEAAQQFHRYLSRYPDDTSVLTRYAEANLAVRPIKPEKVGAAISAYRRLFRQAPEDPRTWKELARLYMAIGQANEAAYVCRQRLAHEPGDLVAKLWLGRSLVSQRNPEEAKNVLSELVLARPDVPDEARACIQAAGLLAGMAAQKSSEDGVSEARAILDRMVDRFPDSAEALLQRARFLRSIAGDVEAARVDLEQVEKQIVEDPGVRLGIADEWLQWNEPQRAAPILESLREVAPGDLTRFEIDGEAWTQTYATTLAKALIVQRRSDEGLALAKATLDRLTEHRRLSFLPVAVELCLLGGEVVDARRLMEEFHQAVADRPDAGESLREQSAVLRAAVAAAEGRPASVIETLDAAFGSRRMPPKALKLLWEALEATGQERRARSVLPELVAQSRRDVELLIAAGRSFRAFDWRKMTQTALLAVSAQPERLDAAMLVLEARLRTDSGVDESLADEITKWVERHPKVGELGVLRAAHQFRAGKKEEALETLETAVRECEPDPEVDVALVNLLVRLDRGDEAKAICRRAVERFPAAAAPHLRLAELQVENGKPEAAVATLQQALVSVNPAERIRVASALTHQLALLQRRDEAIPVLRDIVKQMPIDIRPRLLLLGCAGFRADRAAAQRVVDELKGLEGVQRGTHWRVEQVRLWMGDDGWKDRRGEMEALLTDASRIDPDWPAPVVSLGMLHEATGRLEAAEAVYRRYIDTRGLNVEVADRLLALLQQQRRFAEADQLLSRLPRDESRWRDHRLHIAMGRGDYSEAVRDLERRIRENPDDARLLVLFGHLIYRETGDAMRALAELDRAESVDPQLRELSAARIAILYSEKRTEDAQALLDEDVRRYGDASAYVARGIFHAENGRDAEAEADFRHAVKQDPASVDAPLALAAFLQSRKRTVEALAVLEEAGRKHPESERIARAMCDALIQDSRQEQRERGRKLVMELMQRRPGDSELLILAADAEMGGEPRPDTRAAIDLLEKAVTADPRNSRAQVRRVEAARKYETRARLGEVLTRALGALPEDADLRLLRAGFETESGNVVLGREMARTVLGEIRDAAGKSALDVPARRRGVAAAVLLADLANRDRSFEEAGRYLDEAMRLDPAGELVRQARTRWLVASGRREEAISELEAARYSPTGGADLETLVTLAELYRMRGDLPAAESCVRDAAAKFPDHSAVRIARWQIAAARGRYEELLDFAREAESRAVDVQGLAAAAALLAESGNATELSAAERAYSVLVRMQPESVESYYGLAHTRYLRGDRSGAVENYRRALAIEPFHAQSLNNLAWILAHDENRPDEALELADRGVRRFPEDPYLLDTRGVIYLQLNRLSDARRDLERCLRMEGHSPTSKAQTLIHTARLYVRLGESIAARKALGEAKQIDDRESVLSNAEREELHRLMANTP